MDAGTRVIIIEELATEIIVHCLALEQDLPETLDLRRVSKSFDAIIMKLIWKDPPAGGLRFLLANLEDYDILGVRYHSLIRYDINIYPSFAVSSVRESSVQIRTIGCGSSRLWEASSRCCASTSLPYTL